MAAEPGQRQDRARLQCIVRAQARAGAAALPFDASPVRRADRAIDGDPHAFEKEGKPRFPVADPPNAVQQVAIGVPVLLEVQAQIQERLAKPTA